MSKPVICPSRANIDGNFYRQECLKKVLLPYLARYYPDGDNVFWPDLASPHYAQDTLKLLKEAPMSFVPHGQNPPNVPQVRPIEDFWCLVKQGVYKWGWEAKSETTLKARIRKVLTEIDEEVPRRMTERVGERVRAADQQGAATLYH